MKDFLNRFFKLDEHKTNVKTEVIAGMTTFMTMAYILAVNPNILCESGMDKNAVFTATVLASTLATLLMGLLSNLPFVLSAGMGLNAYFTFTVVKQMGCSWQLALAAVFTEGVIFIILSLTNVREAIFNAIPKPIKIGVTVGIGLYIAMIGLKSAGIIISDKDTLVRLLSFKVWGPQTCSALLAMIGILFTGTLMYKKVTGSILFGILITWVLGMICEATGLYVPNADLKLFSVIPNKLISTNFTLAPTLGAFINGFKEIPLTYSGFIGFFSILFAFLFVDLFDTLGTLIGCAYSGNMLDKDGKLPGIKGALTADALGTTLGAALGTSTVTTFVESASGVSAGGRTGLTALTASGLFFISLFFSPIFLTVPAFATAPALVMVGYLMVTQITKINFEDPTDAVPAYIAFISMPFFYSISEGISFGIISYNFINLISGNKHKIHPLIYILSFLFILKYILI